MSKKEYYITKYYVDDMPKREILFTSTGAVVHSQLVHSAQTGNKKAKDIILAIMETTHYQNLIRRFPRAWRPDAVQQAHLSTLEAVNKFDLIRSKACKFETYAAQMIKTELERLYNNCILCINLPVRTLREYNQAKREEEITTLKNGVRVHGLDMLLALVPPTSDLAKGMYEVEKNIDEN